MEATHDDYLQKFNDTLEKVESSYPQVPKILPRYIKSQSR